MSEMNCYAIRTHSKQCFVLVEEKQLITKRHNSNDTTYIENCAYAFAFIFRFHFSSFSYLVANSNVNRNERKNWMSFLFLVRLQLWLETMLAKTRIWLICEYLENCNKRGNSKKKKKILGQNCNGFDDRFPFQQNMCTIRIGDIEIELSIQHK